MPFLDKAAALRDYLETNKPLRDFVEAKKADPMVLFSLPTQPTKFLKLVEDIQAILKQVPELKPRNQNTL